MRLRVRVLCAVLGLACLTVFLTTPAAVAQVAGQNVNMVSGTKWPTGDPFLQRQNEPSMAVSTRNPLHILAGANDYRSVDLEQVLTGGAETGDAWLGLFKSFDGGYTWQSNLLPGCPYAIGQCKDSGALRGTFQAAADPVVRAGTNGMFFYAGLAFDRATSTTSASSVSSIFVARYNDLNNNEQIDPITYIDTHIVASGNSTQFLDKPSMAVDIPRSGAGTCSFTANEPGVGANGGSLAVKQSFAAGNIYLAYTDFLAATKANSTPTHLMITRSTDCGVTWSTPIQLNTGTTTSQGSAIAVNPVTGAVYVAWRQFASTGFSDAIMIAQSTNAGKSFSAPIQISKFTPFDQGTTGTSFRTNAYPALTSDMFGFVYVAFSARGVSSSGDARVVAAGSLDGTHWTPAIMVDNPPQSATNPSGRGHQIMPAMTFANGRLTLLYYDLRLDHYANFYTPNPASLGNYLAVLTPQGELAPPSPMPNEVFTPYIDDAGLTLRRHTLDLRVLELGIFPTVVLGPSVLVSQYEFGCCVNPETLDIEQFKFNVPNLPLFDSGQEAFLGDYIDIVPSPAFVPSGNSWAYNFMPSVNPLFHATWTDNRDVVPPPPGGSWENYTAPVVAGAISVENGNPLPACVPGQEGMRNQNIYTSQITGGLVAAAPGNAKPLGTTTFNGKTVPFQRAFPVVAQNTTNAPLNVRFTIANQPTGGTASFLQFSLLTTLDITIPPYSSVSRSVFATSTNAAATITVNVAQISAIGGSTVSNGLTSSAVLNPDITNPGITNPGITNPGITNPSITNDEVTNPGITNPGITNPSITNPGITNPDITNSSYLNPSITNPGITNSNVENVSATNPSITNPGITNPGITNPGITNPGITNADVANGSIQDVTYPITNNGNTTASYTVKTATGATVPGGIVLQLLINKLYQTPVAANCQLGVQTHWVTVANITNPKLFTVADPSITNPDITNSTPNEGTVTLAPGETAYITLRVVNPSPATISFNPLSVITPVTVPQAVNTTTVLANPGNTTLTAPAVYPPVTIVTNTLPATDRLDAGYSVQLQAVGGKPGADTWSIASGALPPGIGLSASGLVSGTATTPGSYQVTIQAADSASPQNIGTQSYTLNVSVTPLTQQFVLTPPDGIVGQAYTATPLAVNGGTPPYIWTAVGLPAGLAIDQNGVISGPPTTANPNGSTVTIKATDSATPPESITYAPTIRVGAVIAITPLTLPAGTIGTPYAVQLNASGGIGGLGFGPPVPATGVALSSNGALTIANPQTSTVTFSVTVQDGANPAQVKTANYTINFAGPVGGNVIFVTQPPNYQGGQTNPNSPIHVQVVDNANAAVPGANVTMSFNGTPPCSTAVLSGTLTQQTNATGDAFFGDLSVDRGQIGYTLKATVNSVFGVSHPFTVNGFCGTGNLSVARDLLTATLLQNGQVLVAGGVVTGTTATNAADLYDPTTGVSTAITGLNLGRYLHTATLLNDGTVLIVGGEINATYLGSAEIYNPGNQTFTALANGLNTARAGHTATLLTDGTVLIAGGTNGDVLNSAEIYDPTAQTFTTTLGPLNTARYEHAAALLTNGKVLIVSGLNASAELYDPVSKTFSNTGSLNTARQYPSATLLPNGQVLVAGGLVGGVAGIGTAELYDPVAGTFSFTGSLNNARGEHTANLLPDGTVLVAGGYNCPPPSCTNAVQGTAEIYNPSNAIFTITGNLINARYQDATTVLNDGTVLIAGGFSGNSPTLSDERFYSTAPLAAMQVTTPTTLANGQPATTVLTNSTAFSGVTTGITPIGFGGILPAGVAFEGFNPLILSGYNFSTTNPATTVNVTTSTFYSPIVYPVDFLIDSTNPGPNNELTIILPSPTRALGMDYGGGAGGSSGSIALSNGFVLPLSNLPPAGQTQFSGFVSATPFSSLTLNITGDSWVLLDLLQATANTALPNATEAVAYTQVLLEQGGLGPLTWTLASGTLPPGISLTPTGILVGTAAASGAFTFAVHLVDSSNPQKSVTSGSLTLKVAPKPATNLQAGPGGPTLANLSWSPSASSDIAGYKVYRGTSSGNYTSTISLSNVTNYIDSNLSPNIYYYVVTAVSNAGVESVYSNEASVVVN